MDGMSDELTMRLIGIIEKLVDENKRLSDELARRQFSGVTVPGITYTPVNSTKPPYTVTCNTGDAE